MQTKPRLSVILQVRNAISGTPGEAIFRRVLESVAWADELVAVDGESSDTTPAILAEFGAQIHSLPPGDDFVGPKELAIAHASGDWILWIDADEVAPPGLRASIEAAMAQGEAQGFFLLRDHMFAGHALSHCGRDAMLRLWRRGRGGFAPPRVHESYRVEGPTPVLTPALMHYSSPTVLARMRKVVEDARRQADMAPDFPAGGGWGWCWRHLVRPPLANFKNVFYNQRGYRDGTPGLAWAAMSAITFFYMNLLIWERGSRRG